MATRARFLHRKSANRFRCFNLNGTANAGADADQNAALSAKQDLCVSSKANGVIRKDEQRLFSFYVHALLEVFSVRRRPRALVFFVASAAHSFAHAALGLSAGWCAAGLARSFAVENVPSASAPSEGLRLALTFGSLGLVAAVVKALGGVVAAHEQARIAARVGGGLRLQVLDGWFAHYRTRQPRQFDHGQESPLPLETTPPASRTAARGVSALTARITDIETGLAQGLLGGGRAVAQLAPLVAALVWISPRLALVAFAVLLPFGALLSATRGAWRRSYSAAARGGEDLLEASDEAIRHADLWVSYSAESKARATVAQLGETLGDRSARIQASAAAMSGANEVLAAVALVGALASARAGWLGNVGDSGRLLAFTVCFFLAYRPIRDLTEARLAWSRASLALADLALLTHHVRAPSTGVACSPKRKPWPLAALEVDQLVLRHGRTGPVTFTVPPGEVVAVVGATGEGKTTLVRTLLGLESPTSGEVRYAGASLTDAAPGLLERPLAWVPQDSALLTDTLAANVSLGATECVLDAKRVASLLDDVGGSSLVRGDGSDRLGAGGVAVSGGERQWIALSRALATSQPVLILDEPTSGLDAASQDAVLEAVARLRGVRSIVLVTHRAEPLRLAHTIVRFEDGEARVSAGPRHDDGER